MTNLIARLKLLSTKLGSGSSSESEAKSSSNGDRVYASSSSLTGDGNSAAMSMPITDEAVETDVRPSQHKTRRGKTRRNSNKPPKRFYERWSLWIVLGFLVGSGTSGYYTVRNTLNTIRENLPDVADVDTFVRDGTMTIHAADGTILQQIGPATREKIEFGDIPDQLIQAFIASEDKNFYEHDGVDYQAIVRAMRTNFQAGEVVEGGSTITQQLARIVFLDQEQTFERKVREALLAQKIESDMEKDAILERYLNLVYLGSGAYGVADAAWIYFGKAVDELTLPEMAMIAGLAPAPSVYSPLLNMDLAEERRDLVLERMVDSGFITEAEMSDAMATEITLNPKLPRNINSATPYFTSFVQQQLPQHISQEEIELGGLTIETTLNLEWQRHAERTIQFAIEEYGYYEYFEQAALVTIDPRSGQIVTMVGGNDYADSQFNRVTQAQRQPGSTFKSLVYATAIASGMSPYQSYEDAPFVVDGYEPQNYGRSFRGTVSLRDALISSINVVAVKTLIDVGFDPVIDIAHRMGIQSDLMGTYSMALGASEVNLLELTSAYGTLANQGMYNQAHGIVRVTNRYGEVIYEANFEPEQAVDADTSAIMTWMLQGVVQGGTGSAAQLGRPVAGKTGTSEQRRDLWFIGYIPQLVTGIWLGNDDSSPTWGYSGTAALTWSDFMEHVVYELPVEQFPELPQLEGREAFIEAEPVTPGQRSNQPISADQPTYDDDYYYEDPYYYEEPEAWPADEPVQAPVQQPAPSDEAYYYEDPYYYEEPAETWDDAPVADPPYVPPTEDWSDSPAMSEDWSSDPAPPVDFGEPLPSEPAPSVVEPGAEDTPLIPAE